MFLLASLTNSNLCNPFIRLFGSPFSHASVFCYEQKVGLLEVRQPTHGSITCESTKFIVKRILAGNDPLSFVWRYIHAFLHDWHKYAWRRCTHEFHNKQYFDVLRWEDRMAVHAFVVTIVWHAWPKANWWCPWCLADLLLLAEHITGVIFFWLDLLHNHIKLLRNCPKMSNRSVYRHQLFLFSVFVDGWGHISQVIVAPFPFHSFLLLAEAGSIGRGVAQ